MTWPRYYSKMEIGLCILIVHIEYTLCSTLMVFHTDGDNWDGAALSVKEASFDHM